MSAANFRAALDTGALISQCGKLAGVLHRFDRLNRFTNGTEILFDWLQGRLLAILATAALGQDRRAEIEPLMIGFLSGPAVLQWAKTTLGL